MSELNQILILRDNAKNQLEQIKNVEDGLTYLNKLSAIETWVKAEKKDAELQNIVAEQKIRTQRILGKLLSETPKNEGTLLRGSTMAPREEIPTLSDIGLNKKQSSTFQQIASIPEDTFEEFISEKKAAVDNAVAELTTTGAVRLAKSLHTDRFDIMQDVRDEQMMNDELRQLAKNIKSKYTKDQIQFLIKKLN